MSTMPLKGGARVGAFLQQELMGEMLQHLEAILGLPDLESFPKTKKLPAKLFDHLDSALGCYDRYINHVIIAEKRQVSCYKGCSACGKYELARGITVLEAINIYRYVRSWPDIEDIYEQNGKNMVVFQQLLAKELSGHFELLQPDDPRIVDAHLKYNSLQRQCAFLDNEHGICRIYPVRPIVCRFFFSLSPVEICLPDHPAYHVRNAVGIDPSESVKESMVLICKRLQVGILNFLSGAFVSIAGDVMEGEPLKTYDID